MAQLFSRAAHQGSIGGFSIRANPALRRHGFTLVEILVAMAITLLIMATIVTVFSQLGTSVADSRASIEMSDQVQGVRDRLQRDLGGLTVSAKSWLRLEKGTGYLEIIEGPRSDLVITDAPDTGVVVEASSSATLKSNATLIPINTLPPGSRVAVTALGDFDDVLMFTSSDPDTPFLGRGFRYIQPPVNPAPANPDDTIEFAMIESNDAEIIWYAIEHPVANQGDQNFIGEPGFRTIYRRALVIAPGMPIPTSVEINGTTIQPHSLNLRQFYHYFDVSVRRVGNFWVPNSLADLTWRQNRFAHDSTTFPYQVNLARIRPFDGDIALPSPLGPLTLERQGEDIMLRNALAFDVRVYDPQAPLRFIAANTSTPNPTPDTVVAPGDPGWTAAGNPPSDGVRGAFVDLNYNQGTVVDALAWFSGPSQAVSGAGAPLFAGQWDTWPFAYEQDGVDQDGDWIDQNGNGIIDAGDLNVDEGTNGFDDNNNNVIDEASEYETQPPYLAPVRGVMVRLRAYEPFSRQVREVSVVENFTGK